MYQDVDFPSYTVLRGEEQTLGYSRCHTLVAYRMIHCNLRARDTASRRTRTLTLIVQMSSSYDHTRCEPILSLERASARHAPFHLLYPEA